MSGLFLGIDPGLTGGFAVLHGSEIVELADLPTVKVGKSSGSRREYLPAELVALVRSVLAKHPNAEITALVERQQAMPAQHATSGFRTGLGAGLIVGVLSALYVPFVWVEPRTWKAGVGLPKGADKGASIELASRLFPTAEIGRKDGRAEALLIAEYGRRKLAQAPRAA